jgi:hypothetical protein
LKPILDQFKNVGEYEKFMNDNAVYMKEKKKEKKDFLE